MKQPSILGTYRNGNCAVTILADGTKIRRTEDDDFVPEKPESMDLKITNRCTGTNCAFCHEKSGPLGSHGDIMNLKFIDTLNPYTEIAIGGGNVLEHPDFVPFLEKCKSRNLICNATFNQFHLSIGENLAKVQHLCKNQLLYGVGISLIPTVHSAKNLAEMAQKIPNSVIHVINGIHTKEMLEQLYDKNLKILILGYKTFGRGEAFYSASKEGIERVKDDLYEELPELVKHFAAVSFDNLAIAQLDVKRILPEEEWDAFYMGDEGSFTMYIDAVNKKYALSSTSEERYDMLDDISPMFDNVRRRSGHVVWSEYKNQEETKQ